LTGLLGSTLPDLTIVQNAHAHCANSHAHHGAKISLKNKIHWAPQRKKKHTWEKVPNELFLIFSKESNNKKSQLKGVV
jgi:hypothetical protein